MEFTFGEPSHGWLQVTIKKEDQELVIDSSDVPIEPIEELIDTLISAINGHPRYSHWSLEPGYNLTKFTVNKNKSILEIFYVESYKYDIEKQTPIFTVKGNFQEIILPIVKEIETFVNMGYKEPHWSEISTHNLKRLVTISTNF